MFLCSKKKVAFIDIPKNASCSLKRALHHIGDKGQIYGFNDAVGVNWDVPGWKIHKPLRSRDKKSLPGVHFFAVVRNPWERYVSMFEGNFRSHCKHSDLKFRTWVKNLNTLRMEHRADQLHYIAEDGNLLVDTILRFESLRQDFRRFCDSLGLELWLQKKKWNASVSSKRDYRTYYTRPILDEISPHVDADAEKFGYRFGN